MSLGLLLTLIFMVLKLTHQIDWAWWQVLLPEFIELGIITLIVIVTCIGAVRGRKRIDRMFADLSRRHR
jgi:hypothetical protein